jgi:hypothetical protein
VRPGGAGGEVNVTARGRARHRHGDFHRLPGDEPQRDNTLRRTSSTGSSCPPDLRPITPI